MRTSTPWAATAAACLVSLAAVATPATAGHLNAVLKAQLDGREEVAAGATNNAIAGDPDGTGEAYVFGVDNAPNVLCYVVLVRKVGELAMAPGNGRQAHLHEGARGSNGPVVVNLAWPQDGQASDCFAEGDQRAGRPVFPTGEAGIVQRILRNPQAFYLNVHNAEYPAGAVRGQLADTMRE